ncbi:uncharacterized protein [Littorina saxatilis]|uniref:Atos-like conserved domain-containing protein n=1 Tax=Littorina saxatilis TaxID=31220 RepID=A0AAN9B1Y8_9CAEN
MKPEVGGEESMAQEEFDPLDLLSRVAMLVLEARTPHHSAKGRVEGPHCPGSSMQQGQHQCSQETFECVRALEFRQQIDHMWKNGIPSCIDVVLYPDCAHGMKEARSLEGTGTTVQEDCLLLERWNIQSIKKWHGEWSQGVPGSMLLRAVRSYLYFSQLSSWLASMHGCIPSCIACKLYAPGEEGEEGGMKFSQSPQPHSFPLAAYGPHGLKVAVLALPRQLTFPALLCALADPQGAATGRNLFEPVVEKGKKGVKAAKEKDEDTERLRGATGRSTGSQRGRPTSASRSSPDAGQPPSVAYHTHAPHSAWTGEKSQLPKPTPSRSGVKGQGKEVKAERSAAREALEGQLRPLELTAPSIAHAHDLHSPKVLMSTGFQSTAPVMRRRQLDFTHPERLVQQDQPSTSREDQQLLLKAGLPVYSPLSPLDMQVFLANLQSIAAPIPPTRPDNQDQAALTYHIKAENAARMRGLNSPDSAALANHLKAENAARVRGLDSTDQAALSYHLKAENAARMRGLDNPDPSVLTYHLKTENAAGMRGLDSADQAALTFHLKAENAARTRGLGGVDMKALPRAELSHEESQMFTDLSESGDHQCSARFQKRKALPFGGDLPMPEPAEKMAAHRAEASSVSDVHRFATANYFPFFSCGKSVDSVLNHRDMGTTSERKKRSKSKAASKTERDAANDFDFMDEGRSSTPVNIFTDKSSPVPFQHSLQQTISQTLRDLNKIVRANETGPTQPTFVISQKSSGQPRLVEAVPSSSPSSSSSSSSSTYSSSPVVAAEDGGRHSDSSTPTNLSCSPIPDDSQSFSCRTKSEDYMEPPSSLTHNGNAVTSTEHTPCFTLDGSAETSVGAAAETSAVTPEISDRVFKDTAVKRRLQLDPFRSHSDGEEKMMVEVNTKRSHVEMNTERLYRTNSKERKITGEEDAIYSDGAYSKKGKTAGVDNSCLEEGTPSWDLPKPLVREAINLNVPVARHPTLLKLKEHHYHLNLSAPEQNATLSHTLLDAKSPSSLCDFSQVKPTDQQPSAESIHKADVSVNSSHQTKHICDTPVDNSHQTKQTCDKKSSCSFYLESPSSPDTGMCTSIQSKNAKGKKDIDWLISSVGAMDLHAMDRAEFSSRSGTDSSPESTDDSAQSRSNGFMDSETRRGQPFANGFVCTDSAEEMLQSNGVANRAVSNGFVEPETGQGSDHWNNLKDGATSRKHSSPPAHLQRHSQTCTDKPVSDGQIDANSTPSLSPARSDSNNVESHKTKSCHGNLKNHRQCCPGDSVITPASCKPGKKDASVIQSNANATLDHRIAEPAEGLQDNDSVFYDKANSVETESPAHCPIRTKSAPSFSLLSAKCTVGNQENLEPEEVTRGRSALRDKDVKNVAGQDRLRHRLVKSASMMFNTRGALPSQSSPAPVKRRSTGRFDYDETLTTAKAIKSAISMSRLADVSKESDKLSDSGRVLSTSAPATTNCLLGNFEESILNGRLEPAGVVDGFSVGIGASGVFCPRHLSLPVTAYFFNLSDDNAPSPYLGHINLEGVGKRGYHIPNKGTLQVTLFNPNKTVVKMFVVMYDLEDMPPNCQTVIRQRTVYIPSDSESDLPSYLRYLIHLRVYSSASGKIYLHTDVRLIFARNKFELDSTVAQYELRSFTETPVNPKYSPKR